MVERKIVKEGRRKGLIIVNTGNGKGKTTAALGVAFRAAGNDFRVYIGQFIKGSRQYGELVTAERLRPSIEIAPMGEGFTWETRDRERDTQKAHEAWSVFKSKLLSGEYQVVVLDEINCVIDYGYLPVEWVVEVLSQKPEMAHVILTGRNAHPEIIKIADLVTEMKEIKHPFHQGITAQKGIEF
jgi:cob(I)alamin adenosyltransferase